MMKTTKEFRMSRSPYTMLAGSETATYRVRHHSADWRDDVERRMAVIEVLTATDGWCDYMTIREPAEVAQVEQAIAAMPITTTTPVDAQIEKILAKYFPSIEIFEPRDMDSLDFHEVFVADLKRAVAEAFAAGRDFEALKTAKKGGAL